MLDCTVLYCTVLLRVSHVLDMAEREIKKRLDHGGNQRRTKFKDRSKKLERGESAPALLADPKGTRAPLPLSEEETKAVGLGLGHDFRKKTFFQPTYCHHCAELLWGLKGQGLMCTICNFVSHEKCIPNLKVPCRHILADEIQDPVAHKWTKPMSFKKKVHCNVCRRRIHSQGVICEVCKYYAHTRCKDNAFNNCKHCATYTGDFASVEVRHHWIEGNLPSSARCEVCTKNCCTTECLSGFRCGWCGYSVHSACRDIIDLKGANTRECTYRDLWHMILIPQAVTHRMAIKSHMEQEAESTGDDEVDLAPTIEEECQRFQDEAKDEDSEGEEEEEEQYGGKGRPCLIVDGSGKAGFRRWRKTTMHPIYLSKQTTAGELLRISLRKCGISDDTQLYYLAEVTDSSKGEERELRPSERPYGLPQASQRGPLRLHLRHKPQAMARCHLRVNNGQIGSSMKFVTVDVTVATTAAEVVRKALISYELENEDASQYCLVELSQVEGVRERVLNDGDCPWQELQDLRRDSLTLSNLQRYYIRHREGGQTSVFIGGIPKDILQDKRLYTQQLKKLLGEAPPHLVPKTIPYERIQVGPAFPVMGGLFLEFPTFELAMRISVALEASPSTPKVIMLPSVYPEAVNLDQEPLLVFINGKSGGNQGVQLLWAFRRHLNPHQVYDLANGGPLPGLYAFRKTPQFRILVGGGDGTFGWVLSALQEMREHLLCRNPPCGLLPLGTGNDLARALNWGPGYSGEKVMQLLLTVEDSNVVHLDRWNMTFTEDPSVVKKAPMRKTTSKGDLPRVQPGAKPVIQEPYSVVMNNYFGIGLDAAIALDFHLAREEKPEKFSSRFHNKGVYLQLGLQKMISKTESSELWKYIKVYADGRVVDLPEAKGVVLCNIQSWGAGADPWGAGQESGFGPAAYDDGILELFGISGVVHMGQMQSGIRNGIRIAQGREFKIEVLTTLPVQVDGEAWPQPPGYITVKCLPEQAAMLKGPDVKHYSRSLTKKEVVKSMEIAKQLSVAESQMTGMSSRRARDTRSLIVSSDFVQDEEDD